MTDRIFPKRRHVPAPERPIACEAVLDGKVISRGQPIRVRNEQGTFVFQYVWLPDGSFVLWGGLPGHGMWRNVRPEQCRHVKRGDLLRKDDDAS